MLAYIGSHWVVVVVVVVIVVVVVVVIVVVVSRGIALMIPVFSILISWKPGPLWPLPTYVLGKMIEPPCRV